MASKKEQSSNPSMTEIFTAMKAIEDELSVRLGLVIFPVQSDTLGSDFGLAVKVYDLHGRCIREVSCSRTYWPNSKHVNWEAAALDCIMSTYKELHDSYIPLFNYLSGN